MHIPNDAKNVSLCGYWTKETHDGSDLVFHNCRTLEKEFQSAILVIIPEGGVAVRLCACVHDCDLPNTRSILHDPKKRNYSNR